MKNIGVFVGRFQPLHYGHISIINQALRENELVIIIIGSKNVTNDRNPFSYELRKSFITSYFDSKQIIIDGIDDFGDDAKWCKELDTIIKRNVILDITECDFKLYGPKKDASTEKYINYVLENSIINKYVHSELLMDENISIDATTIRKYIKENNNELILKYIPMEIFNLISK